MYIHVYMYINACIYKYIYVYMYVYMYIYIYLYLYKYVHVYIYVYNHIYFYIHAHTWSKYFFVDNSRGCVGTGYTNTLMIERFHIYYKTNMLIHIGVYK